MKLYFIREEDDAFIIERYDSAESDDCNKEVFRGKEVPVWVDDLEEGVNLFYVEYSDREDCYCL